MRVLLVHWNAAEARPRCETLRRFGAEVVLISDPGDLPALRRAREEVPDAAVIDLTRAPSRGRDVGTWLRRQRPTRQVPLVFVGGEPEKVLAAAKLLPDAVFVEWDEIRGAIRTAIRSRPSTPVVPGVMDGYSGRPLPAKLGIRERSRVLLMGAPRGFERCMAPLPAGVSMRRTGRSAGDIVLLFVRTGAELVRRFPTAVKAMAEPGRLWIVWPKKSARPSGDLTQVAVRAHGLGSGLVDFKICRVDETWSGLCFTRRKARPSSTRA